MQPLSASDIIRIWEVGLTQGALDRALTALAPVFPELTRDELASLSLGQRDALLLAVREWLFGADLNCFSECPRCHERLEFTVDVAAVRGSYPLEHNNEEYALSTEGFDVRFRLLNSQDVSAVAACRDKHTMRQLLVQRCVLEAHRDGTQIAANQLPEAVIMSLAAHLAEYDPQAEVLLNLECPACGYRWQETLDIVAFFWQEISAQAKRLLGEVHTLAWAYGWREADILAMSPQRRQYYLEMIGR